MLLCDMDGCPLAGQKREYLCVPCLILFVIGRWTHLDTLNTICHLSDRVWSWMRSVWIIFFQFWKKCYDIINTVHAKRRIGDLM